MNTYALHNSADRKQTVEVQCGVCVLGISLVLVHVNGYWRAEMAFTFIISVKLLLLGRLWNLLFHYTHFMNHYWFSNFL